MHGSGYFYRPLRSWGKVIFSVACVKNFVHRGEYLGRYPPEGTPPWAGTSPWAGIPPWAGTPPGRYTPRGRYTPLLGRYTPSPGHVHPLPRTGTLPWSMSGRYTSYWNAFLFWMNLNSLMIQNFLLPEQDIDTSLSTKSNSARSFLVK